MNRKPMVLTILFIQKQTKHGVAIYKARLTGFHSFLL